MSTKAGFVALVGRPNAGKSTLMNALIGEQLSIVTAKAQTTWERVTGLRTEDGVQAIFMDTPGLLDVRDLHQRAMLEAAHQALRDSDMILVLLDGTSDEDPTEDEVLVDALSQAPSGIPRLILVTKCDQLTPELIETRVGRASQALGAPARGISSADGTGIEELWHSIAETLPENPFFYPEDDLATQPVRFFVAEFVRETIFEQYEQEIPYSVVAKVEEFRESDDPVYILVHLHVERESQKGILVGAKGRAIRELGVAARARIETFLGRRVYLDLWVKPLPGWRRKRHHLKGLGFHLPEEK